MKKPVTTVTGFLLRCGVKGQRLLVDKSVLQCGHDRVR
jgi:hypothetical protein